MNVLMLKSENPKKIPRRKSMKNVRITGSAINFGNLTGLIGNWQGANGYNMIAVPDQKGEFELLVAQYTENLIINAVPATTPNRGYYTIANLPTLQYATTIVDSSDNSLMHVEGGFWELMDGQANDTYDIFRLASVPHGDAVEAMGRSTVIAGPPVIDTTLSGIPTGVFPSAGYTDPYLFPTKFPGFAPTNPNQTLVDYLKQQEASGLKVTQTVELTVSTQNNAGGMTNIPSLTANASPTQFDATFWIETLTDGKGNTMQQLQYTQRILIDFPISTSVPGATIVWPHINVNTLTLSS
jgi:hypothetical protein